MFVDDEKAESLGGAEDESTALKKNVVYLRRAISKVIRRCFFALSLSLFSVLFFLLRSELFLFVMYFF